MFENLYEYMFKRKSSRKYEMTSIPEDQIDEIKAFADNLKPLYPDIKVEYELSDKVKNLMPIKAPHYFIISSENKDGYLTNVGFMFQQIDLYLSSMGLGSCWLGMARPSQKIDTNLEFVITLAFGSTPNNPYREPSAFKRKPISEISAGTDDRIESARLAPSASNTQNWFFACENGKIHVYQKKANLIKALLYQKMNEVDIGIAVCHLYIATLHQGKSFTFVKESNVGELSGFIYIGTVA